MNRKQTMNKIQDLYDEISELGIKLIESEARKILLKHPNLEEFIMAMGTAFFTERNVSIAKRIIDLDELKYLSKLNDIIIDLNDKVNIMGYPMRFTANGEVINNW